jgi:hypothetical protein
MIFPRTAAQHVHNRKTQVEDLSIVSTKRMYKEWCRAKEKKAAEEGMHESTFKP